MPKRAVLASALCLLLLPAGATAAAPADVQVGKVAIAKRGGERVALLVGVRYPVELDGRALRAKIRVAMPNGDVRTYRPRVRGSSGRSRRPERRQRFAFVHSIELSKRFSRMVRRGAVPRVSVLAVARLDVDRDGRPEHVSRDWVRRARPGAAGPLRCGSLPQLLARPGRRVSVELPRCGAALRWSIGSRPPSGRVRIRDGRLFYWPPQRFRGTGSIELRGRAGAAASAAAQKVATPTLEVAVGTASKAVVRAIGDSVTAGFGYYSNGKPMPFSSLLSCKPAEKFYNDACSSNSISVSNRGKKVEYAPDYGLSNNVSWVAQWANDHGISNFKNFAITGSEPVNWLPGGQAYATIKQLVAEKPDYVLMTMGANPLLSEMLFGIDNMGCAISSDILGEYRKCIERAFAGVDLRANLKLLYEYLVKETGATIYLMQYHLSVPSTALAYTSTQIAEMGALLNGVIASVAAEVNPKRLRVVAPPHFNVGIDIRPVYPATFSCSRFGFKVDGPSVQSTPTQDELLVAHPLSFCSGPVSGPPWVISGDTGIHPSAAGYAQMASQVPAPTG